MNKRSFFRDGIVTGLVILFLFLLLVSSKTEAATTRSGVWLRELSGSGKKPTGLTGPENGSLNPGG